ncbi:tetraspanin-10 [Phtheirospermum japonicum]|uniref:Tetraspanin-10 n=1 Tax=Phtheirospermum japonicum TaxID=374723 RepID=A0A830BIA0_9LAMI|nr:tetraspanin-10 [Phtheirospermum japonicum]
MSSGTGTSTFIIRWVNFLTILLAIGVIGFGVWMSSHHDNCRKSLTMPVIGLGAVIFVVSIIGFLGALKNNSILLWMSVTAVSYLALHHTGGYFGLHGVSLSPTIICTRFIVTNNGSGHNVTGLRYKEYQLHDYSSWFLKQLNNSHNWEHLKSCLVKSDDCNSLAKKYKTLKQLKLAKLSPIEAGCCRPPSECGYPAVNASFYDLSFHPISSNKDCRLYKNSKAIKCYNCDSCNQWFTLSDVVLDEMLPGATPKCERIQVRAFFSRILPLSVSSHFISWQFHHILVCKDACFANLGEIHLYTAKTVTKL